jgi:hypothetical protein
LWCHATDADRLREISWDWLGGEHRVAVCSDVCEQALRDFASRPISEKSIPPDGVLDFLAPFPEFWGFDLHQDEATIRAIALQNGLLCLPLSDDTTFVCRPDRQGLLLYIEDGNCNGMQWCNGGLVA